MNTQRQGQRAVSEALHTTSVQNSASADPKMSENSSPSCLIYLHMVYLTTLSVSQTTQHQTVG
jgi:hypothetical protein